MKGLLIILSLSTIAYGESPAPYQPRGWRPSGPQFQLPTETRNQNQQTPCNQYGTPHSEYLPQLENIIKLVENSEKLNQQYGTPNNNNFAANQQQPNNQQYAGAPDSYSNNYNIPSNNAKSTNQYNTPNTQNIPNNNYGAPSNGRIENNLANNQYGAPNNNNHNTNAQNIPRNNQQAPPVNQYGAPINEYRTINQQELPNFDVPMFRRNNNNENGNNNVNNQYGAPNKLNEIDESGSGDFSNTQYGVDDREVRTTTQRNEVTTEQDGNFNTNNNTDDYENSTDNPNNVAIAVANADQYYILQPDGKLQRVIYKTERNEEDKRKKGNAFSARLVYEDVEPIRGPIYTYNQDPLGPLVQISK